MFDITSQSLTDLIKNIKEKKISSSEATKAFIERGEKSRDLNTYITEDFSNALENAESFDKKPNFDLVFHLAEFSRKRLIASSLDQSL